MCVCVFPPVRDDSTIFCKQADRRVAVVIATVQPGFGSCSSEDLFFFFPPRSLSSISKPSASWSSRGRYRTKASCGKSQEKKKKQQIKKNQNQVRKDEKTMRNSLQHIAHVTLVCYNAARRAANAHALLFFISFLLQSCSVLLPLGTVHCPYTVASGSYFVKRASAPVVRLNSYS